MDKHETIQAVRALYLAQEIAAVNVFCRLEHILSGPEIAVKVREWDQVRLLERELQGDQGVKAPAPGGRS